jgi:hypothetical protein
MFDYLGHFTRAQWNVLMTFVRAERTDITFRILHLDAETTRLKTLRKKLMTCENALGGTSLAGNAGDPGSAGTSRITSAGTTDALTLKTLLGVVSTNTPNVVGGDKPWMDTAYIPNKLIISDGGVDDLTNAIEIQDLKIWISAQIKRRREQLEYKLKKINDRIELIAKEKELLNEVLVPAKGSDYLESRALTVEGRFTDPLFKDESLFETSNDFRLWPQVPDQSIMSTVAGEPKIEQSLAEQQVAAKVSTNVGAQSKNLKLNGFGV